jgi:hypothetical protein
MNFYKLSVWLMALIVAIIGVAFVLSILPQEIIWLFFIIALGYFAFRLKGNC